MPGEWKTLSSRQVYENPWITVQEDEVINPAGKQTVYGIISSTSESVCIVPVDDEGYTYLVSQYRYPIKLDTWECPAGRTDGEDLEVAARRELLEETGLEADEIVHITDFRMSTSLTTFKAALCMARGVRKVSDKLDEVDGINGVRRVSLSEICQLIVSGELDCAYSMAALLTIKELFNKD